MTVWRRWMVLMLVWPLAACFPGGGGTTYVPRPDAAPLDAEMVDAEPGDTGAGEVDAGLDAGLVDGGADAAVDAEPAPDAAFEDGFDEQPDEALAIEYPNQTPFCPLWVHSPLRRVRTDRLELRPSDAWATLLAEAERDTEVVLYPGVYTLPEAPVIIPEGVTVRGVTGVGRVTLLGPGAGLQIGGPDVAVVHLTLMQAEVGISVLAEGADALIYAVEVLDVVQAGVSSAGGAANGAVRCSEVGLTPSAPEGAEGRAGLSLSATSGWTVADVGITGFDGPDEVGLRIGGGGARDTLIERVAVIESTIGLAIGPGANGGSGHEQAEVRNSVVYRRGPGGPALVLDGAGGARILHNTFRVGESPTISLGAISDVQLLNNLLSAPWSESGQGQFTYDGNLADATDADFVMPGGFHLAAGSHALGAGIDPGVEVDDIDGEPRSGGYDVGCDQR